MRALVIASGGADEELIKIASHSRVPATLVSADIDETRVERTVANPPDKEVALARVDSPRASLVALGMALAPVTRVGACDLRFVKPLSFAALAFGCSSLKVTMSLSTRHPREPTTPIGATLRDYRGSLASEWEKSAPWRFLDSAPSHI